MEEENTSVFGRAKIKWVREKKKKQTERQTRSDRERESEREKFRQGGRNRRTNTYVFKTGRKPNLKPKKSHVSDWRF